MAPADAPRLVVLKNPIRISSFFTLEPIAPNTINSTRENMTDDKRLADHKNVKIGINPASTNEKKHAIPNTHAGRPFDTTVSELRNSETPIENPSASKEDKPITKTTLVSKLPAWDPETMAKDVMTPSTAPKMLARVADMICISVFILSWNSYFGSRSSPTCLTNS